ncbi:MAG: single-stranded DNA-binding protein [Planctomycetia bacterium]
MANLNKVMLIGRLTRDPESRSIKSGSAVVNFGMAVNRTYTKQESGERVEETCFLDLEAWGRQGETIARYMKKGSQIYVEGRLKLDTWEKDGQKQSKLRIVVENFQFLDSRGGGGEGGEGGEGGGGRRSSGRPPARGGGGGNAPVGDTPQDDYPQGGDDIPF